MTTKTPIEKKENKIIDSNDEYYTRRSKKIYLKEFGGFFNQIFAWYVNKIIDKIVKQISVKLAFKSRLDEEKTLGIIKKIENGLRIPPVR